MHNMNDNSQDEEAPPSGSAKLLSGNSLLQVHINSGKTLPKDGSKDFSPANSWIEKKQVQAALDERKDMLDEERVEKWGCLANAVWDHKKKLAKVTRRSGKHFQTLGFEKDGTLYLYPEEALYLLETNSLEVTFGGVPLSIQQGYSLLLGPNAGCELTEYRTYSHLLRQGYKLLRFTSQKLHTKYERMLRIDQHAPVKRSHPGQCDMAIQCPVKLENSENSSVTETEPHPSQNSELQEVGDILVKKEDIIEQDTRVEHTLMHDPHECLTHEKSEGTDDLVPEQLCGGQANIATEAGEGGNICDGFPREKLENVEDSQGCGSEATHNDQPMEQLGNYSEAKKDVDAQNLEKEDSVLSHKNVESSCEFPTSHKDEKDNVAETTTKAQIITESLLSLGEGTLGDSICGDTKDEELPVTLQSKLVEAQGEHAKLKTSVTAFKAANQSHMSSSQINGRPSDQEISGNGELGLEDGEPHNSEKDSVLESSGNLTNPESLETQVEAVKSAPSSKLMLTENLSLNSSSSSHDSAIDSSPELPTPNAKAKLVIGCSQDLKRPASGDEKEDCDPVFIKKARKGDIFNDEVEVLDTAPVEKNIELVNLSDESSMDSVNSSQSGNDSDDSIEVIDVKDSSSSISSSTDSDESSSESDSSVIVENESESNDHWERERKNILESIPDMSNLSEISLAPPSSDLLPTNVQPQSDQYIISRKKLKEDSKNSTSEPDHPVNRLLSLVSSRPQPPYNFGNQTQQVWQPNMPVNLADAVMHNIAQFVYPMLGCTPPAPVCPSEQMWRPQNSNFPFQPAWSQGPHFSPCTSRGNHWQRPYRHRPYGFRPRYNHQNSHRKGWNFRNQFATNYQPNQSAAQSTCNQVAPWESTSNSQEKAVDIMQEQHQQRSWMQQQLPRRQKRVSGPNKGSRQRPGYFSHHRKHLNLTEGSCDTLSVESDDSSEISEANESVKTESLCDGDNKMNLANHLNLNENSNTSLPEGTGSTDGSCGSSLDVKPLLSPGDCTSFENVFKTVQVIKQVDAKTLISTHSKLLKPQYDIFSPSKAFKKGNPPLPDFHLCITSCADAVPAPSDVQALTSTLDDNVPILFAVVSPDSLSFIELTDVNVTL